MKKRRNVIDRTKWSKVELVQWLTQAEKDRTLAELAFGYVARNDTPDASHIHHASDGESYKYTVYGYACCHGGLLIRRFRYPGQRDSFSFHYLDEWLRAVDNLGDSAPTQMERLVKSSLLNQLAKVA